MKKIFPIPKKHIRRSLIIIFIGISFCVLFLYSKHSNITQEIQPSLDIPKQTEVTQNIQTQSKITETDEIAFVTRVIDGDTIEVTLGGQTKRVRYVGVDTPETVDPRKPVQCMGKEASLKNKELVEGKEIRLVKDISDTDRYGRLLRYVYQDNLFINEKLVREGFARVYTYPPDVTYIPLFLEAQKKAQQENIGLWALCDDTETTEKTSTTKEIVTTTHDGVCTIKGNINTTGEKIYHLSYCGSYEKTVINESSGEKWFCTENEALQAGWRKALNC